MNEIKYIFKGKKMAGINFPGFKPGGEKNARKAWGAEIFKADCVCYVLFHSNVFRKGPIIVLLWLLLTLA